MVALLSYAVYSFIKEMNKPFEWDVVTFETYVRNAEENPSDYGFIEGLALRDAYRPTKRNHLPWIEVTVTS
jgi:hypothetical protein